MAAKNDITGDSLISKVANKNYADNYDRIFGKKNKSVEVNDDSISDTSNGAAQTESSTTTEADKS